MNTFEKEVIKEINKFRENPQSIKHNIEVLKRGLSRLKPNDPFLKEIDNFINQLKNMKSMKKLEVNPTLTKIAKSEVKKFTLDDDYNCYKQKKELKGIVPNEYINQDAALVADDGADEAENVVPKILLNKLDLLKIGREVLTNPNYTQIGIGHEIFEEENYIVVILAKAVAEVEEEVEVPDEDLSLLKQAFDLFDRDGSQKIRVEEAINAMKSMRFDVANPDLFTIIKELNNEEWVTWPNFASHVVGRMSDRKTEDGLRTIFNLFIDNPDLETITFDTFKRICKEIGETLSEDEMKKILENTTENGNEINFTDFCTYMKIN
jgi:Ca2+-binding EF-hand superfamily protein